MQLSNAWYNRIKWLITIGLPAVGAFYFALAQLWDFPKIPGVNGTINAVIAFLGLIIGYSTKQYNQSTQSSDGDLVVVSDPDDGTKHLGLVVNNSVDAMAAKDKVTLTVVDKTHEPPLPTPPLPPPSVN